MTLTLKTSRIVGACVLACCLGASSAATTITALVTVSATTSTITSTTLTATGEDESNLLVEATGVAYVTAVTFDKTGDSSDSSESSTTDLNAAVAIDDYGTLYLYDSTITADGVSANALHVHETGSYAYLYDLTLTASGDGSHGIYVAGGYIYAESLVATTNGVSGSAIATDTGGGTIVVKTATVNTNGLKSALLYSTGNITVTDLTGTAAVAPAACIDGANSFEITDSSITSGPEEHGVLQICSTTSGGETDVATAVVKGGSLEETRGIYGLIFVGNVIGDITLNDVEVTIKSGIFVNSSADSAWGTTGSNGGTAVISATDMDIVGDSYVDDISSLSLSLYSTTYSGAINTDDTGGSVTVYLDSSSTWTVTGDSYVTVITDEETDCSNIVSDGYIVYYDSASNTWLDGATISLSGGGSLTPS
ncbi:hypothetical protein L207DRAFT_537317 [Hyaloscypha variabilis F]|uniref:Glycoside hydrolase family 28 protein n=1 Tax=Hyaloscypha variabilis (strain UAMH 11265 / GT02V1 / F) TaxID=1149755 RepID=A0A2J6QYM5_HYAVF|nr:hypothetical protein L207DRAFT_537317 [Hyaloscypha variabilis F]